MKKITMYILLMTFSAASFCQSTTNNSPVIKTDYLKKSKNQKTAAWVMLGAGTVLTGVGLGIGLNEATDQLAGILTLNPETHYNNTGEVLFYSGLVTIAGSIPFFISSSKNKRRAMSLSFKNERAPQILNKGFVKHTIPSLTLKISL